MKTHVFTSESVGAGHPDKVADFISDSILDACLARDPEAHVACETLVKDDQIVLAGEISCKDFADIPLERVVKEAMKTVGYTDASVDELFCPENVKISNFIGSQSPDIARGVNCAVGKDSFEQGAGDQGIVFGYACDETPELLPATVVYAHALLQAFDELRRTDRRWKPDCKSQVSICYDDEKRKILGVETVILSLQHTDAIDGADFYNVGWDLVNRVFPKHLLHEKTQLLVNPTGKFVIGGPHGDCGLTGRKIIVDTYGGRARHGGGAFSGKDASKVDRSGAYFARYIAKHIVATGIAKECEVQIAYAIGEPEPVSLLLDFHGTNCQPQREIENAVRETFSFKVADMIQKLGLKKPIFRRTTNYGHFTKSDLPWERTDKAGELFERTFRVKIL